MRELVEKYKWKEKTFFSVYRLREIYDRMLWEVLKWVLMKKRVPKTYINVMKDVYEGSCTSIKSMCGKTEDFWVKVCTKNLLSPYQFSMAIYEVIKEIQGKLPWWMLFPDDIVLVGENREEVKQKLDVWRLALEGYGKEEEDRRSG